MTEDHLRTIAAQIGASSGKIRESAQRLTNAILKLEEYLGKIPGRVETSIPLKQGMNIELTYTKVGKDWRLVVGEKLLVDSNLNFKIWAADSIRDLMLAMKVGQKTLIDNIDMASLKFECHVGELTL